MGIKSFHIFFISVSALMFFGLGVWRLTAAGEENGMAIVQSVSAFGIGAALVVYGIRFLRKLRGVGYM